MYAELRNAAHAPSAWRAVPYDPMAPPLYFRFSANQLSGSSYPVESAGVDCIYRVSFITSSMVWLARCRILVPLQLMGWSSDQACLVRGPPQIICTFGTKKLKLSWSICMSDCFDTAHDHRSLTFWPRVLLTVGSSSFSTLVFCISANNCTRFRINKVAKEAKVFLASAF